MSINRGDRFPFDSFQVLEVGGACKPQNVLSVALTSSLSIGAAAVSATKFLPFETWRLTDMAP